MLTQFRDRTEAGKLLAAQLAAYANQQDLIVLALPRGGVPVGFEIALALHAPLDVIVVRKLGVPGQEELAMGAIATGGIRILNKDVVQFLNIPDEELHDILIEYAYKRSHSHTCGRWHCNRRNDACCCRSTEAAAACPHHHRCSNRRALNMR